MKSHKYWSIGALVSMIGTCYTGYKDMKSAHKYFAFSSLICMAMAIYSGHKMISGKSRKKKEAAGIGEYSIIYKPDGKGRFHQALSNLLFRFWKRWLISFVCRLRHYDFPK